MDAKAGIRNYISTDAIWIGIGEVDAVSHTGDSVLDQVIVFGFPKMNSIAAIWSMKSQISPNLIFANRTPIYWAKINPETARAQVTVQDACAISLNQDHGIASVEVVSRIFNGKILQCNVWCWDANSRTSSESINYGLIDTNQCNQETPCSLWLKRKGAGMEIQPRF